MCQSELQEFTSFKKYQENIIRSKFRALQLQELYLLFNPYNII